MAAPRMLLPALAVLCLLGSSASRAEVPPAPPDGGAAPAVQPATAPVRVHGRVAFEIKTGRPGAPAAERARAAATILQQVIDERGPLPPVTLAPVPGRPAEMQLRVGDRTVITLGPEDLAATGLDTNVYRSTLRAQVEGFLKRERRRARLQETVLSVSLVVFFGLCTVLALRWLSRRSEDAQASVLRKAASLGGLRIKQITVLSPQAVESGAYLLLGAVRVLGQVGIVYLYLAFTLSQFEATRRWVGPLTDLLASPFTLLVERLGHALPALVLLLVSVLLVRGVLRVVGFFFEHVARGEFRSTWLRADLAPAARPVARVAIALLALLALAPIVSGRSDGILASMGLLALGVVGLGAVPVVAAAALGAVILFTRRYRPGEWVQIGRHCGEVTEIGFLDVTLVPPGLGRVRVPHLVGLFTVVRHLPGPPPLEVEVPTSPRAPLSEVTAVLGRAAAALGAGVEVRLVGLSAAAARYRVTVREPRPGVEHEALALLAAALLEAGVPLGAEGG